MVRFTITNGRRFYVLDSTGTWTEVDQRVATRLVEAGAELIYT